MSVHLFRIDAARWRPLRIRLSPTFTSGKLKDMFHLLLNCSDHFEQYLNEIVSKDEIVECRDLTSKFTVDVIGSCAFGLEMNALKEENNEFQKMGRKIFRSTPLVTIRLMLKEMSWLYKHLGYILDDHDVTKFITDITRETIEYRKQNNVRRHDFIDTLIDLKDNPDKLGFNGRNIFFFTFFTFFFHQLWNTFNMLLSSFSRRCLRSFSCDR